MGDERTPRLDVELFLATRPVFDYRRPLNEMGMDVPVTVMVPTRRHPSVRVHLYQGVNVRFERYPSGQTRCAVDLLKLLLCDGLG